MTFFLNCLQAPIDDSLTTPTEDMKEIAKRMKNPHWKIRQTSMHFLFRMF